MSFQDHRPQPQILSDPICILLLVFLDVYSDLSLSYEVMDSTMEACCTCATLLSDTDSKTEKPRALDRRLDCCGRVICGNCMHVGSIILRILRPSTKDSYRKRQDSKHIVQLPLPELLMPMLKLARPLLSDIKPSYTSPSRPPRSSSLYTSRTIPA